MKTPTTTPQQQQDHNNNNNKRVLFLVVMYAACSSSLSIVNKWALLRVPYPSIVTACQFCSTSVVVYALGLLGVLEVDPLEGSKLLRMAPINVVFYCAIFANGKVLQYSTVETFIAFRSLTPLLVALLDTIVRREEPAPSSRTTLTLVAIAAGAASYARDDANFDGRGYAWASLYLVVIVLEMVYAKHVTRTIGLSTWGLVLYQNGIALCLSPLAMCATGELQAAARLFFSFEKIVEEGPTSSSSSSSSSSTGRRRRRRRPSIDGGDAEGSDVTFLLPLALSCVLAVGISFAGWGARSSISATQFTVLGVACKLATVAINVLVWDHHAPLLAQVSILICIFASVLYQQSANQDKARRLLNKS